MPERDSRPFVSSLLEMFKRGGNTDERLAERRVGVWILAFLVLVAVIYLGVKLASRDINRGGPTIESWE